MTRPLRWFRFIIYILFFVVLYRFLTPRSTNDAPEQKKSTEDETQNDQRAWVLPWFQRAHRPLPTKHVESIINLEAIISQAREAFADINGIPGTLKRTAQAASTFQSLVDCWTKGRWVSLPQDNRPIIAKHFQDPLYNACEKQGRRSASQYVWQPQCPMDPDIDVSAWCTVLNGRHMLLVGDLVQYQLHEVILDVMRDGPTVCFGELNCKDHTVCGEPDARLRYLRNDVLSRARRINKANGHPSVDAIEWPFVTKNILDAYSVMIINRSPVLEDDETFARELIETLRTIREGAPDMFIIYRSTWIGHPHCDEATEPLSEPLSEEQMMTLPYGWSHAQRRNAIARAIVQEAGGLFIDMAALLNVRPDGHVGGQDCLRYCIPGPLDTWAQILYNVFLESARN